MSRLLAIELKDLLLISIYLRYKISKLQDIKCMLVLYGNTSNISINNTRKTAYATIQALPRLILVVVNRMDVEL